MHTQVSHIAGSAETIQPEPSSSGCFGFLNQRVFTAIASLAQRARDSLLSCYRPRTSDNYQPIAKIDTQQAVSNLLDVLLKPDNTTNSEELAHALGIPATQSCKTTLCNLFKSKECRINDFCSLFIFKKPFNKDQWLQIRKNLSNFVNSTAASNTENSSLFAKALLKNIDSYRDEALSDLVEHNVSKTVSKEYLQNTGSIFEDDLTGKNLYDDLRSFIKKTVSETMVLEHQSLSDVKDVPQKSEDFLLKHLAYLCAEMSIAKLEIIYPSPHKSATPIIMHEPCKLNFIEAFNLPQEQKNKFSRYHDIFLEHLRLKIQATPLTDLSAASFKGEYTQAINNAIKRDSQSPFI